MDESIATVAEQLLEPHSRVRARGTPAGRRRGCGRPRRPRLGRRRRLRRPRRGAPAGRRHAVPHRLEHQGLHGDRRHAVAGRGASAPRRPSGRAPSGVRRGHQPLRPGRGRDHPSPPDARVGPAGGASVHRPHATRRAAPRAGARGARQRAGRDPAVQRRQVLAISASTCSERSWRASTAATTRRCCSGASCGRLGMAATTCHPTGDLADRCAVGYDVREDSDVLQTARVLDPDLMPGCGMLWSTVADLARFLAFAMTADRWSDASHPVLSPRSLAEMQDCRLLTGDSPPALQGLASYRRPHPTGFLGWARPAACPASSAARCSGPGPRRRHRLAERCRRRRQAGHGARDAGRRCLISRRAHHVPRGRPVT